MNHDVFILLFFFSLKTVKLTNIICNFIDKFKPD